MSRGGLFGKAFHITLRKKVQILGGKTANISLKDRGSQRATLGNKVQMKRNFMQRPYLKGMALVQNKERLKFILGGRFKE